MTDFVLLWSNRLNAVRVEALDKMLSANRQAYRDAGLEINDWMPIAMGSEKDMLATVESLQPTLANRARIRHSLLNYFNLQAREPAMADGEGSEL